MFVVVVVVVVVVVANFVKDKHGNERVNRH